MNKKKLLSLILIIIIVIDQITKAILINKNIIIIPNFLEFNYVENMGVAFGIGNGKTILIIIMNVVVLGFIIKFLKEQKEQIDYPIIISLVLVLAGGISNLIDRIFRGYVIDFIDINIFKFPCFNVADISITAGIIILIIIMIRKIYK